MCSRRPSKYILWNWHSRCTTPLQLIQQSASCGIAGVCFRNTDHELHIDARQFSGDPSEFNDAYPLNNVPIYGFRIARDSSTNFIPMRGNSAEITCTPHETFTRYWDPFSRTRQMTCTKPLADDQCSPAKNKRHIMKLGNPTWKCH